MSDEYFSWQGGSLDLETVSKDIRKRSPFYHPSHIIEEKAMPTMQQIKDNKFYIGSQSIFTRNSGKGWGHPTLEEAIEHAKELAAKTDDTVIVVQIVQVVKQKRPDLEVIKVL